MRKEADRSPCDPAMRRAPAQACGSALEIFENLQSGFV